MWKENLYQPFEILVTERTVFLSGIHQHSFFELGYVLSGTGCLTAFGEKVEYRPGTLFLIPPETTHCYDVSSVSRFVFLRFTRQAIADCLGRLVEPFLALPGGPKPVALVPDDAKRIRTLFLLIWREKTSPGLFADDMLMHWAASALMMTARNLAATALPAAGTPPSERIVWLLPDIQRHIGQPDMLRTEALCRTFHFSRHYLGRYFRRHFQENLGSYIARCRMQAVENALVDTAVSIKEIAWRFGFADASHLTRAFRRHSGKTPMQFRKEYLARLKERQADGQGHDTQHGGEKDRP